MTIIMDLQVLYIEYVLLWEADLVVEIDTLIFYETFYFTLVVVPQTYDSHSDYIIPTPVVLCTTSELVCALPSWLTYLSDLLPTARRWLAPVSQLT